MGKRHTHTPGNKHHRHSKRVRDDSVPMPYSDSWRSGLSAHERGYDHAWRKARALFLQANPLCVFCQAQGITCAASVVDHITPHRGDRFLFWAETNWQALCKACHDTTKKEIEAHGYSTGVDADGWPTDPLHPINAKGANVSHHSRRKKTR